MKLWIEVEYEIDGKATKEQIEKAAMKLIQGNVVTSEELDDGEDYAFLVNSIEILRKPPK